MKTIKFIFLLLFTMSLIVCCEKESVEPVVTDISLSDNYRDVYLKRRGHWGSTDNRAYPDSYEITASMRGSMLTLKFENEIEELRLQIKESGNKVILDKIISSKSNSSYNIPVTFVQNKTYMLEVSNNLHFYYLEFIVK